MPKIMKPLIELKTRYCFLYKEGYYIKTELHKHIDLVVLDGFCLVMNLETGIVEEMKDDVMVCRCRCDMQYYHEGEQV